MTALRRRMLEDRPLRNLSPQTQTTYSQRWRGSPVTSDNRPRISGRTRFAPLSCT